MRTKTSLMAALAALSLAVTANSQIRFNNQWSIQASGGIIPGNGYDISAGAERILGSPLHSISGEISFQSKAFVTDTKIPEDLDVHQYMARVTYTYTPELLLLGKLYIGLSIGPVIGYEAIRADLKTSSLAETDGILYGGVAGVKAEYSFVRKLSLFLEPQAMYVTSSFKRFLFVPRLGIKYYL